MHIKLPVTDYERSLPERVILYDYSEYFEWLNELFFACDIDIKFNLYNCFSCNWHCFTQFYEGNQYCLDCMNELKKKIEKEKPIISDFGIVYIMEDVPNICKIGFTKKKVEDRRNSLSNGFYRKFTIKGTYHSINVQKDEKYLHDLFKSEKIKKEWFSISYEEIKEKSGFDFKDYQPIIREKQ